MSTTVQDLVKQATAGYGADGAHATRLFIVTDLGGDVASRVPRALVAPGIPRRFEPHPGLASVLVDTVEASLVDGDSDSVYVTVNYKTPTPKSGGASSKVQISTGVSLVTIQTNKCYDDQGKLIDLPMLQYTWGAKDGANRPQGKTDAKGGLLDVSVPIPFIRFTRREKTSPRKNAQKYGGRVNSTRWLDGDPRTWRCEGITGDSDDGGLTYLCHYDFTYMEQTWDATLVFIDEQTGKPPLGINDPPGNGIKDGNKVYPKADFSQLGLSEAAAQFGGSVGFTGL